MQAHPVPSRSDLIVHPQQFPFRPLASVAGSLGRSLRRPLIWQRTHRLIDRIAAQVEVRNRRYDPLTGLLNRAALESRLTAVMMSGQDGHCGSFAVLVVDIDNFGCISDSAGQATGDRLLQRVAVQLQRQFQDQDGYAIARLERGKFAILVHQSTALSQLADHILSSFDRPVRLDGQMFHLTAYLGIAERHLPASNGAGYIHYAEAAVQTASQPGQARCVYASVATSTALNHRLQLEADLRRALVDDQLVVYYQPIVDGATLEIVGFEALVRWQHPERGLISPAEFIPMAEQSGMILDIGWWVMTQACAQMVAWQQQFPAFAHMTISVNVSNRQFVHPDCIQKIDEVLSQTQLAPDCLTLEITESAFMAHNETTQATLCWIAAQQIGLSIDDFGTGYSSLSYLYRFPISTIKIDRSFIQAAALAQNSGTIVESVIALGHKLGLRVVAEGVETTTAVSWLQAHQCDQLQGFLFACPVTASEATALLAQGLAIATYS